MCETFHRELDVLLARLINMLGLVQDAMSAASAALIDTDAALADQVVAGYAEIVALHRALDDRTLALLTQQRPAVADVQTLVAALRISIDLRRMGRLAQHVAEVARTCHPWPAIPVEMRPLIRLMDQTARRIVTAAGEAVTARDTTAAPDLEKADDEVDRLHDSLYRHLFDGTWQRGTAAAVRAALIGRYYERYADHAVALAHHTTVLAGTPDADTPVISWPSQAAAGGVPGRATR